MDKKYKVIYADPPWDYADKRDFRNKEGVNTSGQGAINHYPSMSVEDIANLPIKDIAEDNSYLFLWATFPNLKEAIHVMESWGFTYKTQAFTWIKTNPKSGNPFFGLGHVTRSNAEVCLLGKRGKPKVTNRGISSVVISPREKHSKKPDEVRTKIELLCGDCNRIELFGRKQYEGWTVLGNEIDGLDIRDALKILQTDEVIVDCDKLREEFHSEVSQALESGEIEGGGLCPCPKTYEECLQEAIEKVIQYQREEGGILSKNPFMPSPEFGMPIEEYIKKGQEVDKVWYPLAGTQRPLLETTLDLTDKI
jgi:N6-adenosine-specific RNA methylase IME4